MSRVICLFLVSIFLSGSLYAKPINFSALKVSTNFQKGNEKISLLGTAFLETGSLKINADKIEIIGSSQRYVQANGNIRLVDKEKQIAISCVNLNYDRETEILRVEDNVVLEDFKEKSVVRAGIIEFQSKKNFATLSNNVRLLKEDLIATAQYAIYDREKSLLSLVGLPEVKKKTDIYKASTMIVNLKTNDIEMHGNVSGAVTDER